MDSKLRPGETCWLGIFLLAELFAVLLRLKNASAVRHLQINLYHHLD
jgi:hypothetical protein